MSKEKLTEAHLTILRNVVEMGSWGVYAEEIPECGDLIRWGLVKAEGDYEGPRMYPTEAGKDRMTGLSVRQGQ
jgi:hypothetical protein